MKYYNYTLRVLTLLPKLIITRVFIFKKKFEACLGFLVSYNFLNQQKKVDTQTTNQTLKINLEILIEKLRPYISRLFKSKKI